MRIQGRAKPGARVFVSPRGARGRGTRGTWERMPFSRASVEGPPPWAVMGMMMMGWRGGGAGTAWGKVAHCGDWAVGLMSRPPGSSNSRTCIIGTERKKESPGKPRVCTARVPKPMGVRWTEHWKPECSSDLVSTIGGEIGSGGDSHTILGVQQTPPAQGIDSTWGCGDGAKSKYGGEDGETIETRCGPQIDWNKGVSR